MRAILVPLRALLVGLSGAGLAWLWFEERIGLAVGVALISVSLGLAFDAIGRRFLPDRPRAAVSWMEWGVLWPLGLASVAAGATVIVTVSLTLPDSTPAETKELIGALGTAITAFLASAFIDWAEDKEDSWLADRIQEAFEAAYKAPNPEFPTASEGRLYVYSPDYGGLSGWGRKARRRRSKEIERRLGDRRPPASGG